METDYEVKAVFDQLGAIDVSAVPELRELVDAALRTGKPLSIRADGEEIATIVPASPKRRRRIPRGKPITADDPIWKIVGMGHSSKDDISENHGAYLAAAKLATMR